MTRGRRAEVVWTPPTDAWTSTRLGRFAGAHGFSDYATLHRWSVTDLPAFWAAVAVDLGVIWHQPPGATVSVGADLRDTSWFPGGTLNYAEHALRGAGRASDDTAIISRSDTRGDEVVTWADLRDRVARCARGLRRLGVTKGDRVAAYAPNIPETVTAFLATASIGAVWASCAPEFGARAVVDRLAQIEPKVLLTLDGYRYGEKLIDRTTERAAIVSGLPTVEHVVDLTYVAGGPDGFTELLAGDDPGDLHPEPVPFDHPLYVLFSSGTTGTPKAIVHRHGGITLEHLKALSLHHDLGPTDTMFWFTTTGWMMWNYLVSGLLTGATIALFDGDPAHPDLSSLWRWADDADATLFGASAPFLMASRKAGLTPERGRLRMVGSTGAPLPAEGFRWVHEALGGVHLTSISGGTDVCTAFVGMVPLLPVRAGEITTSYLGCAVEAFDASGAPCPPGTTGELVVTQPMPSMPIGFWGDVDGRRFGAAYFDRFPGSWCHGDWISFGEDGSCEITGRSDATLNRGGVRLGTSEFYAALDDVPELADCLVVHLEGDDGGSGDLLLFVALEAGSTLDDDLRSRIAVRLRTELSPRHVPDQIEAVPSVPRTLSGKKLEVPVKQILLGRDPDEVASRDSLADPASLDHFVQHRRSDAG